MQFIDTDEADIFDPRDICRYIFPLSHRDLLMYEGSVTGLPLSMHARTLEQTHNSPDIPVSQQIISTSSRKVLSHLSLSRVLHLINAHGSLMLNHVYSVTYALAAYSPLHHRSPR